MKKGISPATIAIVVVVLGALALASQKVTPPPPGPPEPPKPVAAATPATPAGEDEGKQAIPPKAPPHPKKPVMMVKGSSATPDKAEFNPNSIDVDTTYWKTYKDGKQGISEMDVKMKQALAKQEVARKAMAEEQKKNPVKPPASAPQ